ncbi:LytR/AlgR family response regulator transcription factor [Flavobacterium sp. UBA6046]|jgi:DNA-binding LytR/AlgR family response regulator|uniref:LytR/AlgR family response regulator transcription factor n=1 Tax=Flavobacterium sp. UBA6046 TaxID=1946552 RepID=UPI0025C06A21|nr:response regulator transcription factor [Flavobacterium sp. UBA6046]
MRFSFLIIDDNDTSVKEILEVFENFPNYFCAGIVKDSQTAIKQIIKVKPQLVIVQIPAKSNDTNIFFETIKESFQYLETMPYFIALAQNPDYALPAIQSGFSDYILMPLHIHQLGKSLFKFEKRNQPSIIASTICIKSYSDYKIVPLQDVIYLKADNNTTDIQLNNGNTVNAFKTLKHFENTLPFYFLRIHKSYIVNINYVSRIYFSKSKCYLNYDESKPLPFSLTYRENVEAIIRKISI